MVFILSFFVIYWSADNVSAFNHHTNYNKHQYWISWSVDSTIKCDTCGKSYVNQMDYKDTTISRLYSSSNTGSDKNKKSSLIAPKLDFNEDYYNVLEVDSTVDQNKLKKVFLIHTVYQL